MSYSGSSNFDAARVAEGALDRCCVGDQWPTARNLAAFQWALLRVAVRRFINRTASQGWRSLLRWRTTL